MDLWVTIRHRTDQLVQDSILCRAAGPNWLPVQELGEYSDSNRRVQLFKIAVFKILETISGRDCFQDFEHSHARDRFQDLNRWSSKFEASKWLVCQFPMKSDVRKPYRDRASIRLTVFLTKIYHLLSKIYPKLQVPARWVLSSKCANNSFDSNLFYAVICVDQTFAVKNFDVSCISLIFDLSNLKIKYSTQITFHILIKQGEWILALDHYWSPGCTLLKLRDWGLSSLVRGLRQRQWEFATVTVSEPQTSLNPCLAQHASVKCRQHK